MESLWVFIIYKFVKDYDIAVQPREAYVLMSHPDHELL